MKLISHKDKRIVKYVHIYKTIEGLSYNYKGYPQCKGHQLKDWQLKSLVEYIEYDAKRLGLELRH